MSSFFMEESTRNMINLIKRYGDEHERESIQYGLSGTCAETIGILDAIEMHNSQSKTNLKINMLGELVISADSKPIIKTKPMKKINFKLPEAELEEVFG